MSVARYVIVPTTDKETIQKVIKTIDDLQEALNNPEVLNVFKELSGQYEEKKLPFKSKGICKALKKCLASHRFVDAAKLMECLSCENGSSKLIFKAGFQALENHPNMTPKRMELFMCHVFCLNCLYRSEVALEATVYFIKHGLFQQAQNCLQEVERAKWRTHMRTDPLIEGLLAAYDGLLKYIEWLRLQLDGNCDNVDIKEQSMKHLADKVIAIFLGLLSQNGPWDIFVVKLIDILEYYNRLTEAEIALLQYVQTNPLHVHAYIYLYNFYQKHNYQDEKQIQCLQKIIEICPSDPRVLDYVLIVKENEVEKCIDMLFNYLNYASNKNDLRAWSIFVELLMDVLKQKDTKKLKILKDIWQEYDSFWPAYQFSPTSIKLTNEQDAKLAVLKASVLYVLENAKADLPYFCEVKKKLNSLPYPDLRSKLSQNLDIVNKFKSDSRERKWCSEDIHS